MDINSSDNSRDTIHLNAAAPLSEWTLPGQLRGLGDKGGFEECTGAPRVKKIAGGLFGGNYSFGYRPI